MQGGQLYPPNGGMIRSSQRSRQGRHFKEANWFIVESLIAPPLHAYSCIYRKFSQGLKEFSKGSYASSGKTNGIKYTSKSCLNPPLPRVYVGNVGGAGATLPTGRTVGGLDRQLATCAPPLVGVGGTVGTHT